MKPTTRNKIESTDENWKKIENIIKEKSQAYKLIDSWEIEEIETFSIQNNTNEFSIFVTNNVISGWFTSAVLKDLKRKCYNLWLIDRKLNGEEEIFSVTKIYSDEKESFEGAFSSIEKTNQKKEKIIKGLEDLAKQRKELVELRENKQKLEDLSKEEKVKVIQLELQVARLLKESKKIRNILLIGRTGNGKSTLGNVLINKNENFEEVFKESNYAASQTKELGIEEFEYDGIKYRIIDTIGFGDTELTEKEVLDKISEVAYSISDGLDQVLFVTKSRFTEEEKNVFNLLKNVLFDETIGKYTTIVRTNFPDFDKPEERQNDIKSMSKDNKTSDVIINSCNNKIIHVDNHPKIKENRDKSRKILLSHLAKCKGVYYPNNLKDLVSRIKSYEEIERKNREEIKKLEESRNKLEKENNEEREKLTRRIEELEKEKKDAEENRRQETREHVENRCSKWIDIGVRTGQLVMSIVQVTQ